ncbi:hypothetical protein TSUD_15150 [Trifolium subterraneum]|uniref:Uncharacterized protein n=1 Tax=Trifolium subterraneum TaxID=3900 RepID=A0A2Z6NDX9_TRISU|nr:hypothetical protein TSUD_15150 [Trifolium subterraneum]
MEMVKNMPESSYELTLKDLVEHKVHHHDVEENTNKRVIRDQRNEFSNRNGRKREGISSRNNSRNLENGGFYLKMGFPISLGSSKKHNSKKKELLAKNNSCSRVSPRSSSVSDGSVNNSKDWWKKKSCSTGNSECDHGGGSMKRYGSSSTSSSSRSNSRN